MPSALRAAIETLTKPRKQLDQFVTVVYKVEAYTNNAEHVARVRLPVTMQDLVPHVQSELYWCPAAQEASKKEILSSITVVGIR